MTDKPYPVVGYSNFNGGTQTNNFSEDPNNQQLSKDNQGVSMPGMLMWIHEEWKKIEIQKVQWDLQRAEFQAQITALHRERNGQESVKRDLIRRIKMLEFALKEERKVLEHLRVHPQQNGGDNLVPSLSSRSNTENPDTQDENNSTNPNVDITSRAYERVQKDAEEAAKASTQWKESIKRLKQYLTEVAYNDTLLDMRHVRLHHLLDRKGVVSSDDVDASQRRQNDVLSSNRPGIGALSDIAASEAALSNFDFLKTEIEDEDGTDPSSVSQYRQLNIVEAYTQNESDKDPLMKRKKITRGSSKKGSLKEVIASLQAEYEKTSSTDTTFNGGSNASETASRTAPLDHITICINRMEGDPNVLGDLATVTPANETEGVNNPMEDLSFARNCKPDSNYTDFPKLIIGNNRSEKSQSFKSGRPNNNNNSSEEDQQGYQGDMSNLLQSRNDERPHWTLRHTLRSHWDAVRTLSFHPDSYACLVTGGDDGCLMLWSMEPDAINASAIARNWLTSIPSTTASESGDDSHFKLSGGDLLPTHSIRAHDGPILSSLVFSFYSGGTPLACSGGLDGNLSVWLLPPGAWVPYESETLKEDVDGNQFADLATTMLPSRLTFTSEHTDAVWGLSSVCLSNGETLIASAGAEGVVKLWSLSTGENGSDEDIQLCCRHSFSLNQDWNLAPEDAPTSLAFVSGGSRLIIGAKSGTLLIVDTQTSQLLFSQFASTEEDESRVYTVAAHNTLPLAVAGLENGHLCFLDTQSASIIQNTVAHQQTVSSVAFEPQGLYFATASHDQSLRLWDVTSRSCVQEMHAHRSKFDESSLAVAFHPRLPLMASAGADSIVNVYSSAFSFSSTI